MFMARARFFLSGARQPELCRILGDEVDQAAL
jgi:hypothetical protein